MRRRPTTLAAAIEQGLDVKVVANAVASTGEPGKDFSAVLVLRGKIDVPALIP
ncbi:hypothetical protein GCM10010156_17500 [Planobispora rosea]|uniref:Uncharacterized protein n=1 Tax=Planobispora rosea TaxID=35762 RepID=A0A8J3RX00_PLARO|nr:hypothetical protein [Planobispora rosea]GGS59269.1 hypothetical protein GCM10010156_17500 [Planobispora rosea]GIH84641.1 hypothetical protein Pro02_30490 [Planobispora rosea]